MLGFFFYLHRGGMVGWSCGWIEVVLIEVWDGMCLCVQGEVHLTDDLHVKINGADDVHAPNKPNTYLNQMIYYCTCKQSPA